MSIQLAVDWFLERGHRDITVFVPSWKKEQSRPDALITDQDTLRRLEKDKILVFTPSCRVQGRRVTTVSSSSWPTSPTASSSPTTTTATWPVRSQLTSGCSCTQFVNDKFMSPDDPLGPSA